MPQISRFFGIVTTMLIKGTILGALLLCAVLCVAWRPSYRASRQVYWLRRNAPGRGLTSVELEVSRGKIVGSIMHWKKFDRRPVDAPEMPPGLHYDTDLPWQYDVNRLGFAGHRYQTDPETYGTLIVVPLWFVIPLTAAPLVVWIASRARRRRRRLIQIRGLCTVCGYDLRATRDRCPECGAVVAHPPEINVNEL